MQTAQRVGNSEVSGSAFLRRALLDNGYTELSVTSEHAVNVDALPPLHKDPFDRMLIAQALVEKLPILTADRQLAAYDVELLGA